MDIKTELERAVSERQKIVDQVNGLDTQRQLLLQEALRLDGEVRLLKKLQSEK